MAGDLPPAPGIGGIGVTLPPETAGRFLPSVDRLENTLRAARRAFDRGDLKGALREDDAAIQLKPEYDAAWLLRGHIFRKDGNMPGAIEAFSRALKINGESQEGWLATTRSWGCGRSMRPRGATKARRSCGSATTSGPRVASTRPSISIRISTTRWRTASFSTAR